MELEKLKKIISQVMNVPVEQLNGETDFIEDLSCDSIEVFQIIMGIEEEFGFEIPTEQIQDIHTINDAVEKIRANQNE